MSDERKRKEMERQAIERTERERTERRKREELERRRRDEEQERFRLQQMAVQKQKDVKMVEELKTASKNDEFLNELEKKQKEENQNSPSTN